MSDHVEDKTIEGTGIAAQEELAEELSDLAECFEVAQQATGEMRKSLALLEVRFSVLAKRFEGGDDE